MMSNNDRVQISGKKIFYEFFFIVQHRDNDVLVGLIESSILWRSGIS